MHPQTIADIVKEIDAALSERRFGAILQLDRHSLAIDFRSRNKDYLLLSANPARPRLYLIARPQRQLEKQAGALSGFGQTLRSTLSGSILKSARQDEQERIVRFTFLREEETGETRDQVLIAQLTGRSANLLLLDQEGFIVSSLRSVKGEGQTPGSIYRPPLKPAQDAHSEPRIERPPGSSMSEAADAFYQNLEAVSDFAAQAAAAGSRLRQELQRLAKLRQRLESDYARHGDPEQHKRLGDLLLANIATARRSGNQAMLIDYYAEGAPVMEVLVDENTSLQDEAARYFARYAKAKRARLEITARLTDTTEKIAAQQQREIELKQIVAEQDLSALSNFSEAKASRPGKPNAKGTKAAEKIPGVRRYLSSDGYEILVGRGAKDNDHLTFRVARPQDLWLHAADYPGSHVVVRNPRRGEIPHRTLVEAAQLAAKFSQAGADARVNVHHTQRKFVSRIKGAAPGLVRLASFKTITAQPGEPVERI